MVKRLWLLLTLVSSPAFACEQGQYRQFDFWLGNWTVVRADGAIAGTNRITRDLKGCVINEHYRSLGGYEGRSISAYDRQTKRWHQSWVDNTGLLLSLWGGLEAGNMVLSGEGKTPEGATVLHRITWFPLPDGRVRQHWQSSSDQGQQWVTAFDGLYKKIAKN